MKLREEFADLDLTEKQFRTFSKRILPAHYKEEELKRDIERRKQKKEIIKNNSRHYNIKDIRKLVSSMPEISNETIANELRQYSGNLELSIVKEEVERAVKGLSTFGKGLLKVITYPTLGYFVIPTIYRKTEDFDNREGAGVIASLLFSISCGGYILLTLKNPKLILPIALTQIGTNIASGIYEWTRDIRERNRQA